MNAIIIILAWAIGFFLTTLTFGRSFRNKLGLEAVGFVCVLWPFFLMVSPLFVPIYIVDKLTQDCEEKCGNKK